MKTDRLVRVFTILLLTALIVSCNPASDPQEHASAPEATDPEFPIRVEGYVFDGPVMASQVAAYDKDGRKLAETRSDSGGFFRFDPLPKDPAYLTAAGGKDLGPDGMQQTFDDTPLDVQMSCKIRESGFQNITPVTTVERLLPNSISLDNTVDRNGIRQSAKVMAGVRILMASGLTAEQSFQAVADSIRQKKGAYRFDSRFEITSEAVSPSGHSIHPSVLHAANAAIRLPDLAPDGDETLFTKNLQAASIITQAITEQVSESDKGEVPWYGGLTAPDSLHALAADLNRDASSETPPSSIQSSAKELHEKIKRGEIDPASRLSPGALSLKNHAPRVSVQSERFAVTGSDVVLDAALSNDPDGDPLTYEWQFLSKPGNSNTSFEDNRSSAVRFTPDRNGTYKIRIRVSDGTTSTDGFAQVTAKHGVVKSQWKRMGSSAPWSSRTRHRAEVFRKQIWLLGGMDDTESSLAEIWTSSGGSHWTRITPQWSPRSNAGTAVFRNQLWILGGVGSYSLFNDVWQTSNGIQWNAVSSAAPWSARSGHAVAVFDDKLWVLGGSGSILKNDIWVSPDGYAWQQVTQNAPWSPRTLHAALSFKGKLWIIGGKDTAGNSLNDVWSSTDGITWQKEKIRGGLPGRYAHTAVVHNGKILVTGGMGDDGILEQTRSSYDGKRWRLSIAKGERPVRFNHAAVSYKNQLWLLGGEDDQQTFNDTWVFREGITPSIMADAGTAQTVMVGSTVTLDGSTHDASSDGEGSFQWSITEKPDNSHAVLYDSNTGNPYFTPDLTGNYRLLMTVSNGNRWTATDEVDISAVLTMNGEWSRSGGFDPFAPGNPVYTFQVYSESLIRVDLITKTLNSSLILLDGAGNIIGMDNDLLYSNSSIIKTLGPGLYSVVPATIHANAAGRFQLNFGGTGIEYIPFPIHRAQHLSLNNQTGSGKTWTGTLNITKAEDEQDLQHYLLYWGSGKTTRLKGSSMLASLAKTGSDLSCQLTGNDVLPDATHLLLFSSNQRGVTPLPLSLKIAGGRQPVRTAAGKNHSCVLLNDGSLSCWGGGSEGQLGSGFRLDIGPVAPVESLQGVTNIDSGNEFSCSVTPEATVVCWGNGRDGRLGNGSTADETLPAEIQGLNRVRSVSTGAYHACALTEKDEVWCWGLGYDGQLGNGAYDTSTVPVQVSGVSDVRTIKAGGFHTCAVKTDGTVLCWGSNRHGQLGSGNTTRSSLPVAVIGVSGVTRIAAGWKHTCSIINDGTVQCWGEGQNGRLGNGQTRAGATPVEVAGITNAERIDAGWAHSCAGLASGEIKCWGYGRFGQLGNGGRVDSSVPVTVNGITGSRDISCGHYHSCAIDANSTLKCWGNNTSGQLGDGSTTSSSTPREITGHL